MFTSWILASKIFLQLLSFIVYCVFCRLSKSHSNFHSNPTIEGNHVLIYFAFPISIPVQHRLLFLPLYYSYPFILPLNPCPICILHSTCLTFYMPYMDIPPAFSTTSSYVMTVSSPTKSLSSVMKSIQ